MRAKLVSRAVGAVISPSVPRRRKPIDPQQAETHLSFVVPSWVVRVADEEAERMTSEMRVPVSRSAVIRRWLEDAAKKRRAK